MLVKFPRHHLLIRLLLLPASASALSLAPRSVYPHGAFVGPIFYCQDKECKFCIIFAHVFATDEKCIVDDVAADFSGVRLAACLLEWWDGSMPRTPIGQINSGRNFLLSKYELVSANMLAVVYRQIKYKTKQFRIDLEVVVFEQLI